MLNWRKMIHGKSNKKLITLPEDWSEDVDISTISVHLTPAGATQGLHVKRQQGREIHVESSRGMPLDYYYCVIGEFLDTEEE